MILRIGEDIPTKPIELYVQLPGVQQTTNARSPYPPVARHFDNINTHTSNQNTLSVHQKLSNKNTVAIEQNNDVFPKKLRLKL